MYIIEVLQASLETHSYANSCIIYIVGLEPLDTDAPITITIQSAPQT